MNKKAIISLVVILLFLGFAIWFGNPTRKNLVNISNNSLNNLSEVKL
ncbi:MAG: hypothetical protein ACP5QN_01550 [Minisyncoccia bacterium]